MTKIEIGLEGRSYPIIIGSGAMYEAGGLIADLCVNKRAAVVSDETVWQIHGDKLSRMLNKLGIAFEPLVVPPGEKSKNLDTAGTLFGHMARAGLQRHDPVIAFGGGVTGDLAGFAASTYMRGVPFIQIPTTLLADVDSSVGGKVAVNIEEGKNLVGSFYQPKLVAADTGLLSTLPAREMTAGMAEVVKYLAIGEQELEPVLAESATFASKLERIVTLCCKRKAVYVERDEFDRGDRMYLNFGHTFGHAIEKLYSYDKYNHGEAVAAGMILALRAGTLLGITESGTEEKLTQIMRDAGLDCDYSGGIANLLPFMASDKKNSGGGITLVLLKRLYEPIIYNVSAERLAELFAGR